MLYIFHKYTFGFIYVAQRRAEREQAGGEIVAWADFGGAVVGGAIASVFGWYVAIMIFRLERETALNIGRKNEIYSPLYAELLDIRSKLDLLPLSTEIVIDSRSPRAASNVVPHFLIWPEMKKTAKHLEAPVDIQNALDKYETLLDKYNHMTVDLTSAIKKALPESYRAAGRQVNPYEEGPDWRSCLIKGELEYNLQYFEMSFDEAKTVFRTLSEQDEIAGLLAIAKPTTEEIRTETDILVDTIESQIRVVINKYESGSTDSTWQRIKTLLRRPLW